MFYVLSFILDSIIQTSSLISIIEWHVQYVEGKVNRHNKVTMINFWIGIVFVLSECKKDFWSCDGKRKQGKKTEKPYISKSDRALHLIRDSFFFFFSVSFSVSVLILLRKRLDSFAHRWPEFLSLFFFVSTPFRTVHSLFVFVS